MLMEEVYNAGTSAAAVDEEAETVNQSPEDTKKMHVDSFMRSSMLGPNTPDECEKMKFLREIYENLTQEPYFYCLLKFVMISCKIKIMYNFNSIPKKRCVLRKIGKYFCKTNKHNELSFVSTQEQTFEPNYFATTSRFNGQIVIDAENTLNESMKFEVTALICRALSICVEKATKYDYGNLNEAMQRDYEELQKEAKVLFKKNKLFKYYEADQRNFLKKVLYDKDYQDGKDIFFYLKMSLTSIILFIFFSYCILPSIVHFMYETTLGRIPENGDTATIYKCFKEEHFIHSLYFSFTYPYTELPPQEKFYLLEFKEFIRSFAMRSWSEMDTKLKQKVLESNFTFQNDLTPLARMNESVPKAFHSLTNEQVLKISDGYLISVGNIIKNDTNMYVERTFPGRKVKFYPNDIKSNIGKNKWENLNSNELDEKFRGILGNFITSSSVIEIDKGSWDNYSEAQIYYSIDDIIDQTQKSSLFILSDEAGSGKTVTFEEIALRTKQKFPENWVSYIDLSNASRHFETADVFSGPKDILENILELTAKNEFERAIFDELLKVGKVVMVWDGFDKISDTSKDAVIDLIRFISQNSKNVQYLSTTPPYADSLEKALNSVKQSQRPFTDSDQLEIYTKYFSLKNISSDEIENLSEKSSKISNEIGDRTPLTLKIIAEAHEDLKPLESIYTVYEKYVDGKVSKNTAKILRKYAIRKEFEFENLNRMKIMQTKDSNIEKSIEDISWVNQDETLKFSHKTFQDFFVAQFLVQNFLNLDQNSHFDEIILESFNEKISDGVKKFLSDFLNNQVHNGGGQFNPEIEELLRNRHRNILFSIIESKNSRNNFEILLHILSRNHELLVDLLHVNDDDTLYTSMLNGKFLLSGPSLEVLEQVRKSVSKYLNDEELAKFTTGQNRKGIILYENTCRSFYGLPELPNSSSLDKVNVTNDFPENFFEEVEQKLTELERKRLLTHQLSDFSYFTKFKTDKLLHADYYAKLWNKSENLLKKDDFKTVIAKVLNFKNRVFEKFPEIFKFVTTKASTLLSGDEIFDLFKSNQLMKKAFLGSNFKTYSETLFQFLSTHTSKEQQKEILLQGFDIGRDEIPNSKDFFALKCKLKYFHVILLESSKNKLIAEFDKDSDILYPELFESEKEIRELILDSNEFLLYFSRRKVRSFPQFLKYLEHIFKENKKSLRELLTTKITGTDYTLSNYFDNEQNTHLKPLIGRLDKAR